MDDLDLLNKMMMKFVIWNIYGSLMCKYLTWFIGWIYDMLGRDIAISFLLFV